MFKITVRYAETIIFIMTMILVLLMILPVVYMVVSYDDCSQYTVNQIKSGDVPERCVK